MAKTQDFSCYDGFIARDRVGRVSEETRQQRLDLAESEFTALVSQVQVGTEDLHHLAMWISVEGYRLRSMREAHKVWNDLAEKSRQESENSP